MVSYILRRILVAIPVLIGVLIIVFLLVRLLPGEPCTALLGERATAEACERFNEANGLDEPIYVQLVLYFQNVLTGDFGESIRFSRPVSQIIIERLPVTLELTIASLSLAVIVGIPLGVMAARRHNSTADVAAMAFANVGVSMPIFWLGLLLAYFFAVVLLGTPFALPPSGSLSPGTRPLPFYEVWGWEISPEGFGGTIAEFISYMTVTNAFISFQWAIFWDGVKHLILPAVTLATIPMAIIARMTRSSTSLGATTSEPHGPKVRSSGRSSVSTLCAMRCSLW
jgi:peptide/nickel transport system permease protein